MAHVYILESGTGKRYIGSTVDINKRLARHNAGTGASTTRKQTWEIVYQKEYSTIEEARIAEKKLKSYKGGNALKKLIRAYGG